MTYTEMIEALKYYAHHFAEQPFDPGVASIIARAIEELVEITQNKQSEIKKIGEIENDH